MNKPTKFIIHNLWWLVPLSITVFFWQHTFSILLLLSVAYIGRIILNPVVKFLENHFGNRKWAVAITTLTVLVLLIFLSGSLWPVIAKQIVSFQSFLTMESFFRLQEKLLFISEKFLPTALFEFITQTFNNLDSAISDVWALALENIKKVLGSAGSLAFALGSAFLSFLIVLVFTIFFLLEGDKFRNTLVMTVPGKYYGLTNSLIEKIASQVHSYIRGQLLAALSVAVTSIIGLYFLQWVTGISIPYTIVIGLTAGLFNLIPFVGPVMGMIPAVILYLITDQTMPLSIFYVLLILGVFGIVQLIDNLVMSPYILSGSVGLHPMLVIILVLLGGSIGGIVGMLLAVPLAAILKVVIEELIQGLRKLEKTT
ncbi:MAG: AI-2E family transporter [Candidatus Marinimicrobia bacterium]|jgi:predicted PurR-regulated permease PerM|nr:AI-2E family transporter [Candidatus Neomarinimicrobiota bacterium]MDP6852709.1 AI-2E family transporter [Candidatus Neomarinimicrobiota bacterium]